MVEDVDSLRELTTRNLVRLGYVAIGAPEAQTALAEIEHTPDLAFLLTDVVLPGGMDGFDLARAAVRRHPSLPVVFVSGFTDRELFPTDFQIEKTRLLAKPYRRFQLAAAIAEALAGAPPTDA